MSSSLRRTVELSGSLSGVGLALGVGAYQGIQQHALALELPWMAFHVATRSAVPAIVGFSVLATLSGLMLTREVYTDGGPETRRQSGPTIAAIVPVYRDGDVLEASVGSLLDSNYEDLEIHVAAEPDDDPTLEVARRLADAHANLHVHVNRQPGSKARAINDAVDRIDSEYFCAFDADERVDPDFVPAAMWELVDNDRDVFQARRVPRANGAVETLAYCERLLFHASYKLIEPLGFTYCRSSSSAFTREAFEAVDGLSDLTTEDIDFAHKCFRQGLDVCQDRNLSNEMEAPHTLRDLWCQRKRWRLGHIEVFVKAVTGGFQPTGIRGAASTVRVATTLFASVFMVALVAKVAVLVYFGLPEYALLPLVAVTATVVPILYHDLRAGHVDGVEPVLVLAPFVYPAFGLVTIRCAFEYLFSWEGEWYQVEKTGA